MKNKNKNKNKNKGFTLVELLIAIAILSALLFTGSYSYQMLASRWQKDLGHFEQSINTTKNINLLYNVLASVQPFIVLDKDVDYIKPAFFFIGFQKSLLSITHSGLFSKKNSEVFRLSTKKTDNGKYNLIYQSINIRDISLLTIQQGITFKHTIILLKNLDAIEFSYLGWNSYMEYAEITKTFKPPTWRKKFSGIDRQLLPIKMRVFVQKNKKKFKFTVNLDHQTLGYLTPYIDINREK